MTEGRAIQGTVKAVKPYGAFVDVGNGVQGLVPIREMSWARVEKSEDIVAVGDEVTVTVKEIDWAEERITLSLRDALGNPWDTVSERYGVGSQITGTVTRIMPFGAFVQLEPGIEGLVHISRLGAGRRVNSPAEVVNEGDQVEVAIESIDLERKRIGLTMDIGPGPMAEESADDRTEVTPNAPLRPGMQFTGTVEEIKDDGRKVSLTLPETLEKERAEREVSDYTDRSNGDLGSLGDLLDGLKL
jgi:small subunit ribosomal protein S1